MTIIIGIKTNTGLESVVLASDRQLSEYKESGDEMEAKRPVRKLYHGSFWAMGDAGADDRDVLRFYSFLRGHKSYNSSLEKAKESIERAIQKKRFDEVRELNTEIRCKGAAMEDTHAFLLAVNSPKLGLWLVDEFGNLKESPDEQDFDYLCLGSGADEAEHYIKNQLTEEKIDREHITTRVALRVARDAVQNAGKLADIGLGYDLLVIDSKEIKNHGDDLRRSIREAERVRFTQILELYPDSDNA